MDCIEYKEGNIKSIEKTCDLLNQLLQSFDNTMQKIAELFRELAETFGRVSKDICESCKRRRTKHGSSSKAKKQIQAKANIKWWEKYRPP